MKWPILITLRIFNDRNEIITRLDEDGFWVRYDIRKKRPNRSTLVVYDQTDSEVLHIEMLNSKTVSIEGKFRHPKTMPITITKDQILTGGKAISRMRIGEFAEADIAVQ
jgi:hypothetical protein